MSPADLQPPSMVDLVRDYLLSDGFQEVEISRGNNFVVVKRAVVGGAYDTRIVWIVPAGYQVAHYESALRPLIDKLSKRYSDARATILLSSGGGLSRSLQEHIKQYRISVRVPIQFFDTAFKVDEAPDTASVISEIREPPPLRVRQPYELTNANGAVVDTGDDLLETLSQPTTAHDVSSVRIIIGRAGIGKSILSHALFARLYKDFLNAKQRLARSCRPIPLLPEHAKDIDALRTKLLIDNFVRTDVAAPVTRKTFEWLLVNGFATWLLDGLDELIAGDRDFFDYILDVVTRERSSACVYIWSRDSLLTTSDAFMDFRELGGESVEVYKLLEWEKKNKREFAWLQYQERLPAPRQSEPPRVTRFLDRVEKPPTNSFSGLPFYCKVLWDDREELLQGNSEVAVLDYLIKSMLDREIEEKRLIDPSVFEKKGIDDWLEEMAARYVEDDQAGVDKKSALDMGEVVLRDGLDEDEKENALLGLLRSPFFAEGTSLGRVSFTHDLIAEAIASRQYAKAIRQDPVGTAQRLGHVNLEDPVLLRLIAQQLDSQASRNLIADAMSQIGERRSAYRVLLALMMIMEPSRDFVRLRGLNLEDALLSELRFRNLDLTGVSFRRSDLSNVRFEKCVMRNVKMEGARIKQTSFDEDTDLEGADFGSLSRVESVRVNRKFLNSDENIREWIAAATQRPIGSQRPCPTAQQVCHLFSKFITPMGVARRDTLKEGGLLAGRRYPGAAKATTCLQEVIRAGYMMKPDHRGRYARARGTKYAEMVDIVKEGKVSERLHRVIAKVCERTSCAHMLEVTDQ